MTVNQMLSRECLIVSHENASYFHHLQVVFGDFKAVWIQIVSIYLSSLTYKFPAKLPTVFDKHQSCVVI